MANYDNRYRNAVGGGIKSAGYDRVGLFKAASYMNKQAFDWGEIGSGLWNLATTPVRAVARVGRDVGNAVVDGAKAVGNMAVDGLNYVGNKAYNAVSDGLNYVGSNVARVGNGMMMNPPQQQAPQQPAAPKPAAPKPATPQQPAAPQQPQQPQTPQPTTPPQPSSPSDVTTVKPATPAAPQGPVTMGGPVNLTTNAPSVGNMSFPGPGAQAPAQAKPKMPSMQDLRGISREQMQQNRRYTGARNMNSEMDRWKTWMAMNGNRNASNADYRAWKQQQGQA